MQAKADQTQPMNYGHAPITEAVIHLLTSNTLSDTDRTKVARRLKELYPHSQPLLQQSFSININETGVPNVMVGPQPQGFRLASDDQADIAIIQHNGILISRLSPYPGWQKFRDRANAVWTKWRAAISNPPVSRIGVRYINRIDIPYGNEPIINPSDYLLFSPEDPGISSAPMQGYLVQITKPTDAPHWLASVTSTLVSPPPLLNHISILFDIDVFRTEEIPRRDDELSAVVDETRRIKNDIFERCITDRTRELIS
jgi:uncharacterized protein (TIGR04255 family)